MFAGVFDEFFGVPTHPLAVHAPVVLIPILAVAAVVVLFRSAWRAATAIPFATAAVVLVGMLFVAKQSGESAKNANNVFGNIDRHEELGNQTFVIGVVWMVLAIAAGVATFLGRRATVSSLSAAARPASQTQVALVLNILATVALVATTIWLIRTGHAGAESRWSF